MTLTARPSRMLCVQEKWGIVCGSQSVDIASLPDKQIDSIRRLVKQSPDGVFIVKTWLELAHLANNAGVDLLPVSIYKARKGWRHITINTKR